MALGIGAGRLRGTDLRRPFRGVRAAGTVPSETSAAPGVLQRARILDAALAYRHRMGPAEFFSHATAALMWDVPLPLLADERPDVSVVAPRRAPRCTGIRGHQARAHLTVVVRHPALGVLVSSPASTWASLTGQLVDDRDLIAAADHLVRIPRMPGGFTKAQRPAWATIELLHASVDAGRRVGRDRLRAALPHVRTGAASRPETWLRLMLIDAGLPEPTLDHDIHDARGAFVGCVDQAYLDARVALEYEGDHHRVDRGTWMRDVAKHDALAALGWRVMRLTADDVFAHPERTVQRVRDALRA